LIQGVAEKAAGTESDEYHASRPHDSQVAAWSSQQSQPIDTRSALDAQYDQALAKFENSDVPRPDYWGMYRIIPTRIEFWKGRTNRMHDRIEFLRNVTADGEMSEWKVQRLQP
jgi:pyridoxamine 5'-phosphate oxidase